MSYTFYFINSFNSDPGRWKTEVDDGDTLIALNSKTYFLSRKGDKDVVKHKGVSKNTNNFRQDAFERALFKKENIQAENRGFRRSKRSKRMHKCSTIKRGLGYFYCKRYRNSFLVSTQKNRFRVLNRVGTRHFYNLRTSQL